MISNEKCEFKSFKSNSKVQKLKTNKAFQTLLRYTHLLAPLNDSTRPLDNSTNSTLHNPQRAGALVTSQSVFNSTNSRLSRVGHTRMARRRLRSARKSARPHQGQGRRKRGNRLGVEAKGLWLRSRKRMRGTARMTSLTEMGSEEQGRKGQSTTCCERDQECSNLRTRRVMCFLQCHQWRVWRLGQSRVVSKHLRVVKVATESNPADMLTKALGRSRSWRILCRDWSDRTSCEDGRQEAQESQVCSWSDGNEWCKDQERTDWCRGCKDQERVGRMQNCDGCTLWIEFSLWNQKGSLNLPMRSWLDLRSANEGSESRANGVAISTSLVRRRVSWQRHLTTDSHKLFIAYCSLLRIRSHRRNHFSDDNSMHTDNDHINWFQKFKKIIGKFQKSSSEVFQTSSQHF